MYPKIMSSSKGIKYPPASAGTHVAILTQIVDCGRQEGRFGTKEELFLSFEITDEFNEWLDRDGPRSEPKRVSATVSNTLSEKAKLREYVEGILGSRLPNTRGEKIDIVGLVLGKACLVHVVHKESGDNVYANISSVTPLPKSMPVPTGQTEQLVYSVEHPDQATWEKLPKFLQEKIAKRVEAVKLGDAPKQAAVDFDDDIPF